MADKYDDFIETLRGEYVDDAAEQLNTIESCANRALNLPAEAAGFMIQLRRAAHTLKGTSATVDYPIVVMIMHKLEDYLAVLNDATLSDRQVRHIEKFVDVARDYAAFDVDHNADCSAMIKALPCAADAKDTPANAPAENNKNSFHAILIIDSKSAANIFEHELKNHNLSVTQVRNPFQALETIIRTQPDIVITSAVFSGITGVDIASALQAMPTTKHIPVSILTSFERGHSELKDLQDNIQIIQKNNMSHDVDNVLKHYKLTA